ERAADPAQVGLVLGQQVGAAQAEELDAVFEPAQEPVGGVQRGGVGAPDIAALGERGQRGQGGAAAQRLVTAAVHQLEQLYGELDIPQPAGAELEFAVGLHRRDVLLDPAAHLLDIGDKVLPFGGV